MLLRCVLWVSLSLVLHAALFAVVVRRAPEPPVSAPQTELWMEAALPAVAPPPPPPPPVVTPPSPAPSRSSRAARAPKSAAPPVAAAPEVTAPVVDGPSSVAVAPGDGANAIGSTGGPSDGVGRGHASAGGGAQEEERRAGPAQLSLWLEPARLDGLALARPTIALLMAMPGYADILRGSGIRPLMDLQRLRLRLSGVQPERLIVAGVHHAGDAALVAAAERIAAMRDQTPVWRGDDDFRATSWVDGSAIDRGLAVHGGAFVIAPRQAMPELLGRSATEESVQAVSRLRDRVLTLITIEDAARYLPQLDSCELQALRISVADAGAGPRMTLAAHYKTASLANDAAACLQKVGPEVGDQMPTLLAWLARAQVGEGSGSAQLTIGVNSNDIEKLFNELAWALRSARRA